MWRRTGQETDRSSFQRSPICQAGLEEGLAELSSHVHQFGGRPYHPSHGSSLSILQMGMPSEARGAARTWEQGRGFVAGGGEATPGWSPGKPPRPWQSQTNRRLEAAAGRGPPVVWVPLTWDLKQTLTGFRDTPWRHQFCPVLLHPIKILGTQSLPTLPQGPESLAAVPSPSVRNSTHLRVGSGQLGSLKHLHEEGVMGGVTSMSLKKNLDAQTLKAYGPESRKTEAAAWQT